MFRNVLVPLDGSSFGERALPLARDIVAHAAGDATLHLVHIHEPVVRVVMGDAHLGGVPILDERMDREARKREQAYLDAQRDQLRSGATFNITTDLVEGPVMPTLTEHAAAIKADLIVMTTHGRGGLARLWLGSVADGLMRHTHIPLLLIRPHEDEPKAELSDRPCVLIPLDGSTLAEQVIAPARALGDVINARYLLLQVIEEVPIGSYVLGMNTVDFDKETMFKRRSQSQHYLDTIAHRLRAEGMEVETQVWSTHQPAMGILDVANERAVDYIALATHGRGGLQRLLIGSVADKVVRATHMPVLIYRPQER